MASPTLDGVSIENLQAFADAWNQHDIDALMGFMNDDCRYDASAGPDVHGQRYEGSNEVRKGFALLFTRFPDAKFSEVEHFVSGNRGVSEWKFSGTRSDGTKVESRGCDLFTFKDGKIAVKNSYRKQNL